MIFDKYWKKYPKGLTLPEQFVTLLGYTKELDEGLDNKTDKTGDHKGSWQGIKRPTLSEEGMRGTVEKHIADINEINTEISDIVTIKSDVENNLKSAISNRTKTKLSNKYLNSDILNTITVDKEFTLEGSGKNLSILNFLGSGPMFLIPLSINKTDFKDMQLYCKSESLDTVGFYFTDTTQYSDTSLSNLYFRFFKKAAIIVKCSFNSVFRDIAIYGGSTSYTNKGILLGEALGDWNNITTLENINLTYCNEGISINNGVKVNILNSSFNLNKIGIKLDYLGGNETRDITIKGNYFEMNDYGIFTSGENNIIGVTIKDNFFSDNNGNVLSNITNLTLQDNTHWNKNGRQGKFILDKIGNLKVLGYNNLEITTKTNKPIYLTGENNYKENIVFAPHLLEYWSVNNSLVKLSNTNVDGVVNNGKNLPCVKVPKGLAIGEIYSTVINGTGTDISEFISARLLGARCIAKVKGNTSPVSISIGYIGNEQVFTEKFIGSDFTDISGANVLSSNEINGTNVRMAIRITKSNPDDDVTVYFDDIQGWSDYLNPPNLPSYPTIQPYYKRKNGLLVSSLSDKKIQGLFFNAGDKVMLNTGVEKIVTQEGFNYTGVEAWTPTTNYEIDDYVTVDGALLRCIKAGRSGETSPKNGSATHTALRCESDNTCVWLCVTNTNKACTFN